MVTNLYPDDGGWRGVFVKEQVDAIRALGHHVDVQLVAHRGRRAEYLLKMRHVARRAETGGYDVIHTHFGMTAVTTRLVRDVPRVLTLHGSDVNETWKRLITRLGWGGTRARIYVSERLRQRAADAAGIVIPNGVSFDLFRPGDRDAARARLGFGEDDRVIMFGSDPDIPVKGYGLFSDVVAQLRRDGQPVAELILAATGQTRSEVVAKFDAADLLLFTSRRGFEGSPMVVKEATVMGLPVVSVDVGDVADILAGVTPSMTVGFPSITGGAGRSELVRRLADAASRVLADGRRSNGRQQNHWLAAPLVAQRVVDVYRSVIPQIS